VASTDIVSAAGRVVTTAGVDTAVHPRVTLSGGAPTGTIEFDWFANGTCDGTPVTRSPAIAVAQSVVDAAQFAQIPRKVGSYAFLARYRPEGAQAAVAGECRALAVVRSAPVGSSVFMTMAGDQAIPVGATTNIDVTVSITGDTAVADLAIAHSFRNEFLALADAPPAGCQVRPQSPDVSRDTIVCSVGTVSAAAVSNRYARSFRFAFRAIGRTPAETVTNSAVTTFRLDGTGQASAQVVGPRTASIEILDSPVLAVPAETDALPGQQLRIPVRLHSESSWLPTDFAFNLEYDPALLRLDAVLVGGLASTEPPQWTSLQPGVTEVRVFSPGGSDANAGDGALVIAQFTVLGTTGESPIRIGRIQATPRQANALPVDAPDGSGRILVRPLVTAPPPPPPQEAPPQEEPPHELPALWDPRLWTTEQVARSIGFSALLGIALTALAEIFNGTIEENRSHFPGWWRRRRPAMLSGRSAAGSGRSSWIRDLPRAALYLVIAAVLFAFLRPERVVAHPWISVIAAGAALVATTGASQLPRWAYLRHLDRTGALIPLLPGQRRVVLHADFWTLGFALLCVVLAYVTAVRPGYAYGIIGVLTLGRGQGLRPERDTGQLRPWRMDLAGMTSVFVVALSSWLLYSAMHGGHDELVPRVVEEMWAFGSETVALGLIPVAFLPGRSLWSWNRAVWFCLWAPALFLYIQSITLGELGAGPLVVALTLVVYAVTTVGFWCFFKYFHDEETCESCRVTAEPELVLASS
jgi:hypothetical protein